MASNINTDAAYFQFECNKCGHLKANNLLPQEKLAFTPHKNKT